MKNFNGSRLGEAMKKTRSVTLQNARQTNGNECNFNEPTSLIHPNLCQQKNTSRESRVEGVRGEDQGEAEEIYGG